MEDYKRDLHVLCYGGGVNTFALLLEAAARGIVFDAILMADTGGESWKTYKHVALVSAWCIENGQPEIRVLKARDMKLAPINLYDNCYEPGYLPSIVYGRKSCSLRFKKNPQDVFLNNWPPAKTAWSAGYKVIKYIGFDADEPHRTGGDYSDNKHLEIYKLVEWGWGRFECVKRILDSGLPMPPKSSCTFCPSMKAGEIIALYLDDRAAFYRATGLERRALELGNLDKIKGLGRHWSWWDMIKAYRYLVRFRRYAGPVDQIHPGINWMVKKVRNVEKAAEPNRAKKKKKEAAIQDPAAFVCDMFRAPVEAPCGCYD